MKMKIAALALLASISLARAQTQGSYTLKDAALPQQTLLMLIYSNAGKSAPASVSSDGFGNPLSGIAGTTNPNGTGLFVQGLTNGLPISTIFAAPQHIICDSGCSGGSGGGGLSVPFAGPIGTNGTPVGFKDASGNLQPLLGDTTFGQWVSIKASATIPISGSVSITGGISSINNITGTVSLPTLASTSTIQTNGSQKTQIVDGSGNVIASTSNNLNVICANCSGSGVSAVDTATYTYATSLFAAGGGFYQATSTNNALTNLQQGMFQITAQRALFTNLRNSSGVEIGTSSTPIQVSLANTGANASAIVVTGAGEIFPVTGSVTANAGTNLNTSLLALESGGNIALTVSEIGALGSAACSTDTGTCNVNALVQRNNQRLTSIITTLGSPFQVGSSIGNTSFGISGTLPGFAATPTFNLGTLNGAATASNQATGNASLATLATNSPALGQALAASSIPVVLTAAQLAALTPPAAITGFATSANQATNGATTAHTCAIAGFSELGCLGQIDDDIKGPIAAGTNTIGGVLQSGTWNVNLNAGSNAIGSITNTSFAATQPTASALNATVVGTGTFAVQASIATASAWGINTLGSTTSGQSGQLAIGAVTTSSPSYTTAQSNALSLTLAGALRVDGSAVTQPVSLTSTTITSSALPTGAATSANQTNGTQQSKLTDGTNVAAVKAANTAPTTSDPGVVTNVNCSYSGSPCITLGPAASTNSVPTIPSSPYPANAVGAAVAIEASSGNVAAATAAATLAAASGKFTYISGFEFTSSGSTVGLPVTCTLSGISTTKSYTVTSVAGVLLANAPLIVQFNPPLPSSAGNTAIVVSCPSLGTGNTNAVMTAEGYQL